jgi:hypothetical protein
MNVRLCLKQGNTVIRELKGRVDGRGDLDRLAEAFWKGCSSPWGRSEFTVEKARDSVRN